MLPDPLEQNCEAFANEPSLQTLYAAYGPLNDFDATALYVIHYALQLWSLKQFIVVTQSDLPKRR